MKQDYIFDGTCPPLDFPEFQGSRMLSIGGSSKSQQASSSTSTTTNTSTTTAIDARKGVSDEAVLAEQGSTVGIDKSINFTNLTESADAEIIGLGTQVANTALGSNTVVAGKALDANTLVSRDALNLGGKAVDNSTFLAEKSFDSSIDLFKEAGDFAGQGFGLAQDSLASNQALSRLFIQETADSLNLASQQNNSLATNFLDKAKTLVQDQNREAGERLGSTTIISFAVVAVLGIGAYIYFNRSKK